MKRQKTLFDYSNDKSTKKRYSRVAHGGDLNINKRKLERPISSRRPIHIVLHAQGAKGHWSFLGFKNQGNVIKIIRRQAGKFGIKIQDFANVGNHLHLKVKAHSRQGFQSFLRSITCLIARKITGACRGNKLKQKFWTGLAFTRVLKSYREEIYLRGYLKANRLQANESYEVREKFLAEFRRWVVETYGRPRVESS